MSADARFYWDEKHKKYSEQEWITRPSLFAQWAIQFFSAEGRILDVGCGQAQDTRYFAERGYDLVGIDFSEEGLRAAKNKLPPELDARIHFEQADISKPLLFSALSFDAVYSHLAIHYFDHGTTEEIFNEFHRVLKPGGICAILVNSVHDPEYGIGEKIETDYFKIGGIAKRYFSAASLSEFARKFEIVICDENGEAYKDRNVGTVHLVRLIARKV
ncbi:class I SAM-dependent methyltransferase [Candidatus Wolfebacteria bacterium]|nr:class I SAM-dependent methyltransferase [Candidatus Wolfebacteria bacterium]